MKNAFTINNPAREVNRIYSGDRYQTAVEISK